MLQRVDHDSEWVTGFIAAASELGIQAISKNCQQATNIGHPRSASMSNIYAALLHISQIVTHGEESTPVFAAAIIKHLRKHGSSPISDQPRRLTVSDLARVIGARIWLGGWVGAQKIARHRTLNIRIEKKTDRVSSERLGASVVRSLELPSSRPL